MKGMGIGRKPRISLGSISSYDIDFLKFKYFTKIYNFVRIDRLWPTPLNSPLERFKWRWRSHVDGWPDLLSSVLYIFRILLAIIA
jgi:hypothetical protein